MNTKKYNEKQFWQACRYVMGELSDAEFEQFEDQLAVDIRLCDDVIEATRLMACAQTVDPVLSRQLMPAVVHVPQSSNLSRTLASIAALAACVVLLFVATLTSPPPVADPNAEVLVDAWLENALDNEPAEVLDNDEYAPELDVPDWMIAGVSLAELEFDHTGMPDDLMPEDLTPDDEDMEL